MKTVPAIFIGYLIGSVPFSYIIPKLLRGIDIREFGSGNIGGSNVIRTLGLIPGIAASILDILKAIMAIVIAKTMGLNTWAISLSGIGAVIGHNWSLYLKFTGGRGIACTLGVLALLMPFELLFVLGIMSVGFLLREAALSVFFALILLPILTLLFKEPQVLIFTATALSIIGLLRRLSFIPQDIKGGTPIKRAILNRLLYDAPEKKKLNPAIRRSNRES